MPSLADAVVEPRLPSNGPKLIKDGDRYHSHGINLNHNALHGPLEAFPDFVRGILVNPNALSSLDLSFNVFTEIPAVREHATASVYRHLRCRGVHTRTHLGSNRCR